MEGGRLVIIKRILADSWTQFMGDKAFSGLDALVSWRFEPSRVYQICNRSEVKLKRVNTVG